MSPETNCFCRAKNTTSTGSATMIEPAARWTSLLVPPELMGSHVGPATSHTTGRTHALRYRAATALLHSFGIEWDMSRLDEATLAELAAWIDLHKQVRPLIGTGSLVHPDHPDPAVLATVAATATQHPAPLLLTGLDPDRTYRLSEEVPPAPGGADLSGTWSARGAELCGRVLATVGVALPVLDPEEARVLRLVAIA